MRTYSWVLLLICGLAPAVRADDRQVTQPIIINPSAPSPHTTPRAGGAPGPLVILVGDAAKQQAAAVRALSHHKRKGRARMIGMTIGAH